MASTVYNGTNLLLKFAVDGSTPVTLGHTTSATLTITHDLPESTSKDSSGFQEVISGLRSGEISFEGLVDYTDTLNHDEIFTMVSNRSKVDFTFGTIITGDAVLSIINGMLCFLPMSETSLIGKTLRYGFGNVSA